MKGELYEHNPSIRYTVYDKCISYLAKTLFPFEDFKYQTYGSYYWGKYYKWFTINYNSTFKAPSFIAYFIFKNSTNHFYL